MKDPYFFGYGSLVNRATHSYDDAHPAQITGWRRVWRHTDLRPVAFLTAVPDETCVIDGLIAGVPDGDWAALDAREHAYDRVAVSGTVLHPLPRAPETAIYSIPQGKHTAPSQAHPILLSYLDVVVQGYLNEFGHAGVTRFAETTSGWDAPLLDDRAAPRYPRAQTLSRAETALANDIIARFEMTVLSP